MVHPGPVLPGGHVRSQTSEEFTLYDLPARGVKEWLILKSLPLIFSIGPENRPQPSPDRESTGLPMPYGIDIAPDGMVWVARLYANDLARIDPDSGEITMIDFPYQRAPPPAVGRRRQSVDRRFPGFPAGEIRPAARTSSRTMNCR